MDLGYRGIERGERVEVVLVHLCILLHSPMPHGTAGAETLRNRVGNVFTPGDFMEPAEEATRGVFMCLSVCVCISTLVHVHMYVLNFMCSRVKKTPFCFYYTCHF